MNILRYSLSMSEPQLEGGQWQRRIRDRPPLGIPEQSNRIVAFTIH